MKRPENIEAVAVVPFHDDCTVASETRDFQHDSNSWRELWPDHIQESHWYRQEPSFRHLER